MKQTQNRLHQCRLDGEAYDTTRALWLGMPLAIDRQMLEAVDAKLLASGRADESIIDSPKKP